MKKYLLKDIIESIMEIADDLFAENSDDPFLQGQLVAYAEALCIIQDHCPLDEWSYYGLDFDIDRTYFCDQEISPRSLENRIPCPVCGRSLVGEYDICRFCNWENDPVQARNPDLSGGANNISLNEARHEYIRRENSSTIEQWRCHFERRLAQKYDRIKLRQKEYFVKEDGSLFYIASSPSTCALIVAYADNLLEATLHHFEDGDMFHLSDWGAASMFQAILTEIEGTANADTESIPMIHDYQKLRAPLDMRGHKGNASLKYMRYHDLIQRTAREQGCVFFSFCGEGREFHTDTMEGEDVSGWLIPITASYDFEAEWNVSNHLSRLEKWEDYFKWAEWEQIDNEIRVAFFQYGYD